MVSANAVGGIAAIDSALKELFPDDGILQRWLTLAPARFEFRGGLEEYVRAAAKALGMRTFWIATRPQIGNAAAAELAGFRPCLRCRPETAPDMGAWNGSSNTVRQIGRAHV